ncbi:MAG: type II secretion system GspH family protein [Lentisphaeraceae bacterium]|nr:type II secretion system GspH family protein [Lentisphaeraceae bacterium]
MKTKNTNSFTLVELLVVIAIIGILLTLLFPSLQNARLASKTATSMSNLKQIHIGTMAYASANNNWLFDTATNWHPYAGINSITGGRNHVMDWQRMSYEAMIGKTLSRTEASTQMALNTPFFNTFFCPALRESRPMPESINSYGDGDYSMNRFFFKNKNLAKLDGKNEPIYLGGTPINDKPWRAFLDFRRSIYEPLNEKRPAYKYLNNRALSSYIDGRIKLLTKANGAEINSAVTDHHDFQ